MQKRLLAVALGAVLILGLFTLRAFSQLSQRDNIPVAVPLSALEDINAKLGSVILSLQKLQALSSQDSGKLDQLLANENQIKEDLNILKLRISKKIN